jgi:hypothetical protein
MRREDWTQHLHAVIEAARFKSFAWGQHDCCLFVADCIDAVMGTNYAATWRGSYESEEAAHNILQSTGGIEAMLSGVFREIPKNFSSRGDVVLLDLPHQPEGLVRQPLGVVDLSGRHIATAGLDGLKFAPLRFVIKGWRIE